MSIDVTGANAYFRIGNHVKANVWNRFEPSHREGAVTAAIRLFSRELRRPINTAEPEYAEGDRIREEYAIYEQALWMLEDTPIADASGGDAAAILRGKVDGLTAEQAYNHARGMFSPEALRWFGWGGHTTVRG